MLTKFFGIIFFLMPAVLYRADGNDKKPSAGYSYFPADEKTILVYESTFGESISKFTREDENIINENDSDRFKYHQTLFFRDDGVYLKDTYQYVKVLLFIKKESKNSYSKPMFRFPIPLTAGKEWKWEGMEYCDGDSNKISVSGKVLGKENVPTKAGSFDAMKVELQMENTTGMKNTMTEWYAEGIGLVKTKIVIQGGGMMGFIRNVLGYGDIEFELKEIRKNEK